MFPLPSRDRSPSLTRLSPFSSREGGQGVRFLAPHITWMQGWPLFFRRLPEETRTNYRSDSRAAASHAFACVPALGLVSGRILQDYSTRSAINSATIPRSAALAPRQIRIGVVANNAVGHVHDSPFSPASAASKDRIQCKDLGRLPLPVQKIRRGSIAIRGDAHDCDFRMRSFEAADAGGEGANRVHDQLRCLPQPRSESAGEPGPPIAGSSRELIADRVLYLKYPPGYKPKRSTHAMRAMPQLANQIDNLYAFLRKRRKTGPALHPSDVRCQEPNPLTPFPRGKGGQSCEGGGTNSREGRGTYVWESCFIANVEKQRAAESAALYYLRENRISAGLPLLRLPALPEDCAGCDCFRLLCLAAF